MLRLSPTKVGKFLHCRMAYYWNYECNLRPKQTSKALQIGGVVHYLSHLYQTDTLTPALIANLPNHVREVYKDEPNAVEVALEAARLFRGFLHECDDGKLKFISSELPMMYEIPEWDVLLYGKPDAWARTEDQRLWKYETKTAGRIDQAYLSGLRRGLQSSFYDFLSEKLLKEKVAGTIHNLIVKTKIPQYHRTFSLRSNDAVDRMLKCVEGVAFDIHVCMDTKRWYPSCKCFDFNRECEYKVLCEHDSKRAREEFFEPYHEVVGEEEEGNDAE